MTSKQTEKPQFRVEAARLVAMEIWRALHSSCERLEIAGSIRRGKDYVHDIDLVAQAKYEVVQTTNLFGEIQQVLTPPTQLLNTIRSLDVAFEEPKSADPSIIRFSYWKMPVEVYLTARDGSNYYALLQMRTGSAGFNATLATRAREQGKYYKAGYGIFESDQPNAARLDDGTEAGIFMALNMPFRTPNNRF